MTLEDALKVIRELGSFGVLIGAIYWVATKVWPKISDHLEKVNLTLADVTNSLAGVNTRLEHIEQRIEVIDRKNDATQTRAEADRQAVKRDLTTRTA
jgi:hypothetical protein